MSFGDGDLHVQVAQLKTENARLKQRNGELESLVRSLYADYYDEWPDRAEECYAERIAALRIEVDT